jgi:hypothetical protein
MEAGADAGELLLILLALIGPQWRAATIASRLT